MHLWDWIPLVPYAVGTAIAAGAGAKAVLKRRRLRKGLRGATEPSAELLSRWGLREVSAPAGLRVYVNPKTGLRLTKKAQLDEHGGGLASLATLTVSAQSPEFDWDLVPHIAGWTHAAVTLRGSGLAQAVVHRMRIPVPPSPVSETGYRGPDHEAPYEVHLDLVSDPYLHIASQIQRLAPHQCGLLGGRIVFVRVAPVSELWDDDALNRILETMLQLNVELESERFHGVEPTPETRLLAARIAVITRGIPHERIPTVTDLGLVRRLSEEASPDPLVALWMAQALSRPQKLTAALAHLPIDNALLAVEIAGLLTQPFFSGYERSTLRAADISTLVDVLLQRPEPAALLAAVRLAGPLRELNQLQPRQRHVLGSRVQEAFAALYANPDATFSKPIQRELINLAKALGVLDATMMGGLAVHNESADGGLALAAENADS